ncbi:hypothetical protein ANN_03326 [Periplaneta americana]|uniref:Mutator-like transposase domain-containing protein n=1 Tax=Periplaneta americana TaxID=6978 RepID=A0ABQ8U1K0_PERAM|nr:hypothetical protein ANN_03326 [Periplaneta americana]
MGKRKAGYYTKKKKFVDNRFTNKISASEEPRVSHNLCSASEKKFAANQEEIASAVANESVIKAAEEEVSLTNSRDISVSCDGTWLTRGHSSLQGVCTVIGAKSGKVLHTQVLSVSCKGCDRWKNKTDTVAYSEWWESHECECTINHKGSSGNMEVEGMKQILNRSLATHNVQYVNYIGDGDTKSYKAVSESQPYRSGVTI